MNIRNPRFWALIGFGVGAVIASAGRVVHPLDSLFGGLIQAALWFAVSSFILRKKKSPIDLTEKNKKKYLKGAEDSQIDTMSIKYCDKCHSLVPIHKSFCSSCSGTLFTHQVVKKTDLAESSEEAIARVFLESDPELKSCPMCAELIKYAEKKCRFCQYLMSE